MSCSLCRVFDDLAVDIRGTGLRLRNSKCGLLWPHQRVLPSSIHAALVTRSLQIFRDHMVALGAPVGFDQEGISVWLREHVDSQARFFKMLLRPDLSVQISFLLLRLCMIPCMGYLARVVPPRVFAPHAAAFDKLVTNTATEKLGLPYSLDSAALIPLSLPVRLGGFGLRSVGLVSPAAYWASLARSAPHILDFVPDRQEFLRWETKVDPFDIKSSHQAICSAVSDTKDLVPADPTHIWADYGKRAVRGLQKALCALIDERHARDYDAAKSQRCDKQRIISCSASNAGAY